MSGMFLMTYDCSCAFPQYTFKMYIDMVILNSKSEKEHVPMKQ